MLPFGLPGFGELQNDPNAPKRDTSETIVISSIALLKMLKHGRAGIPMEVMGLMLGEFVDEYTISVADVFAMPQSGTGTSVEAVDPIYQQEMVDLLSRVARTGSVVGWYHSHPGFGCWLSSVDMSTQQSMEKLDPRAVAVVVDPVQSVSGRVVIDAFRLLPAMGVQGDSRQTTSNRGHVVPPSAIAQVYGLGVQYYSLPITYRRNDYEDAMLDKLGARSSEAGLEFDSTGPSPISGHHFVELLAERIKHEHEVGLEQSALDAVGKLDPRRALMEDIESMIGQASDLMSSLVSASIAFTSPTPNNEIEAREQAIDNDDESPCE